MIGTGLCAVPGGLRFLIPASHRWNGGLSYVVPQGGTGALVWRSARS